MPLTPSRCNKYCLFLQFSFLKHDYIKLNEFLYIVHSQTQFLSSLPYSSHNPVIYPTLLFHEKISIDHEHLHLRIFNITSVVFLK